MESSIPLKRKRKKNFLLLISWGTTIVPESLIDLVHRKWKALPGLQFISYFKETFLDQEYLAVLKSFFEQVPTGAFASQSFSLNFGEQIVKTIDLFCVKPLEIILKAKVSCRNFFCIRKGHFPQCYAWQINLFARLLTTFIQYKNPSK